MIPHMLETHEASGKNVRALMSHPSSSNALSSSRGFGLAYRMGGLLAGTASSSAFHRRFMPGAAALAILLVGTFVAPASVHATVVLYSDIFDGSSGVNLAGTTPDVTTGSNTWQGNTGYKADGSFNFVTGGIYLPFTANPGNTYTLSVTFFTANNSGDWIGAGFSSGSTTSTRRLADNQGRGWVLLKNNGDTYQGFIGPGTGGQGNVGDSTIAPAGKTSILTTSLDASSPNAADWTFSSILRVDTTDYTVWTNMNANVTSASQFTGIGLSSQSGVGRFTEMTLSSVVSVPEPSTFIYGGITAALAVAIRLARSRALPQRVSGR